jgi:hypothetical protein
LLPITDPPAHGPPKYKVGTEVLYRTKQKSTHSNKNRSTQEAEGMDGESLNFLSPFTNRQDNSSSNPTGTEKIALKSAAETNSISESHSKSQ